MTFQPCFGVGRDTRWALEEGFCPWQVARPPPGSAGLLLGRPDTQLKAGTKREEAGVSFLMEERPRLLPGLCIPESASYSCRIINCSCQGQGSRPFQMFCAQRVTLVPRAHEQNQCPGGHGITSALPPDCVCVHARVSHK